MPYNLDSPNTLLEPIDPSNIERWFVRETIQVESEAVRHVLHHVAGHLADFVQWPLRAVLLWDGCDRCPPTGKKQKYHRYPESISTLAKAQKITLDSRPNGPARAAFMFAGGVRSERFGSTNASTMHHVYGFPTSTTRRQHMLSNFVITSRRVRALLRHIRLPMHSAMSTRSSLGSCGMKHSADSGMTRTECSRLDKTLSVSRTTTIARLCS